MHFPKALFFSIYIYIFFYSRCSPPRTCIAAHRTIEKRDVRSSGARKIAEFIDRAVARKIYIRARCGQTAVLALSRLSTRTSVYAYTLRYIECVLSIINTQSYGRLNAGLPPASGPIIICGIVRVGPISKTAVDRDLCRSQSTKSFRQVIISALPLLSVRFPVVRAISTRLVHRADELFEIEALRIGRHCRRLFDRLIATAVHTYIYTCTSGARRSVEKRTVLHFIGFL